MRNFLFGIRSWFKVFVSCHRINSDSSIHLVNGDTCRSYVIDIGIPADPRLAETFYEQEEFVSDSDGDDDMESMCSNLQSVLFDVTRMYC